MPENKRKILLGAGVIAAVILMILLGWWVSRKSASPLPSVTATVQDGKVLINKDGKTIATRALADFGSSNVEVVGENSHYAYVAGAPEGLEGEYLVFDPGYYKVYQVDISDQSVGTMRDVSHGDAAFQAASPDGTKAAYAEYGAQKLVLIKDLNTNVEVSSTIPVQYGQFGSMHFSPDSKQVAFAAALGFPGKENGAVFVVNAVTGAQRLIALTKDPDTYFIVRGWKDNTSVDYVVGPNKNVGDK